MAKWTKVIGKSDSTMKTSKEEDNSTRSNELNTIWGDWFKSFSEKSPAQLAVLGRETNG